MRTAEIFIIAIYGKEGSDGRAEIEEGAQTLFKRCYLKTAGKTGLIEVRHDVQDVDAQMSDDIIIPKSTWLTPDVRPTPGETNIGVYVFGHGSGGTMLGSMDAERMVDLFAYLKLKTIRKLCLLSCSMAAGGVAIGLQATGASFLELLCAEMRKRKYRSKVAGWGDYVSIVSNEKIASVYQTKKKLIDYEANAGRKVAQGVSGGLAGKKTLVTDPIRQQRKFAYEIRDGEVLRIGLADWSDKDVT